MLTVHVATVCLLLDAVHPCTAATPDRINRSFYTQMLSAFDEAQGTRPASETAKYHLVHEGKFDARVEGYVRQAGKGTHCDFAVSDWPTKQTVAYSRVVGASRMCGFNDTRTPSAVALEYKARRKLLSVGAP